MGILNNLMDRFKNAEFTVAPQKKLKTISADFKKAFELTLVFYKGMGTRPVTHLCRQCVRSQILHRRQSRRFTHQTKEQEQ